MFNVFISMTNSGHSRRMFPSLSPKTVLACVSLNLRVTRIRVNGGIHVYRLTPHPVPGTPHAPYLGFFRRIQEPVQRELLSPQLPPPVGIMYRNTVITNARLGLANKRTDKYHLPFECRLKITRVVPGNQPVIPADKKLPEKDGPSRRAVGRAEWRSISRSSVRLVERS
ncbi:hypothetical protein BGY98DRAFT_524525 [Russula aff. rugulosa BPL654]|nr:hypothetical protein BGY98DRAFT_524525 [Russula aff. rugulosa BPL654]